MEKRKKYCNVDYDNKPILALEDRYTGAVEEWTKFKAEALKNKEKLLLELYPSELVGDSEEIKRKRNKAIRNIKQA